MEKNKKPILFLILKIIGILGFIVAIIGITKVFSGFGNFETNTFMTGGFMMCFGFFIGVSCTIAGFTPEIAKLRAKTTKYIQEENKQDLTDIATNTADITSDAITKTTKAIKKGMKDTKFCTQCGSEIDRDSKFCNECGKEQ